MSGGSVTGNNKVWRQFTFSAITTSKIRVVVNAGADNTFSRVVEVEAWTAPPPVNFALAANGATAIGSSTLSPYYASGVNDGSRRSVNNGIWLDNTYATFPDWIEVDFNGSKTISEIDVITQQDDQNPVEPTLTQTFSLYGITAFDVQYWDGSAWLTVPGGSVTGNNKVWRQFTFSAITTSKIRVVVNAGADNTFSRVVEVEAWGSAGAGGTGGNIRWLVSDHLGTPRMVFDKSGSLAATKRHDYLPFGEELYAGQGVRTAALGYTGDTIRQKFTRKERDNETGLDYFLARYYSSTQGRFTSPDEFTGGPDELYDFTQTASDNPLFYGDLAEPQTLNKYQYAYNNPLSFIDPDGHQGQGKKTITERLKEGAREVGRVAKETATGAASSILENNGFPGIDAPQNEVGRTIGDAASLVQGGYEVVTGVGMIAGGGAEAGITAPACATGVGCAVPAVGVATAVVGVGVTAHGGFVFGNTLNNIFNKNSSGQGSSGNEQNKAGPPKKDRSVEGTRVQRENIEKAQRVNRQAGRPDRIRSIEKSKQNERTALKKIKKLKDVEDQ